VSKQGDDRTRRLQKWIASARHYQQRLERRPWVALSLESVRRFNKIDGKHLPLDLPFAWRDLIPGAAVCTGAAIVVHAVSALFLRNWFGVYGHAYGGFGISLALATFVGIIASFWVWIAAVMGVWWERKAGPAAVAKMEKMSAGISASR
jgi:hypothetical protein